MTGIVTFTDRRELRDGIRNKDLDDNFAYLAAGIAAGGIGAAGADGVDGVDGTDGVDGVDGATGSQGATGPTGPVGIVGPAGADGDDSNILNLDGGRAASVYQSIQSIIGGGA